MMLAAEVHLGTKNCDFQMERYVFKRRNDGIPLSLSLSLTLPLLALLSVFKYISLLFVFGYGENACRRVGICCFYFSFVVASRFFFSLLLLKEKNFSLFDIMASGLSS